MLEELAAYLAGRPGKDIRALLQRLREAVSSGAVKKGAFNVADVNIMRGQINTQGFLAAALTDISSKQSSSPATAGADRDAARSTAQAHRLRQYQALVERLA
jgi:uncharacterized protein YbjT (DUF2867 family)